MIRIEELRIGNELYVYNDLGKKIKIVVNGIEKTNYTKKYVISSKTSKYWLKYLYPIPITEKHLIELGATKTHEDRFKKNFDITKSLDITISKGLYGNLVYFYDRIIQGDIHLHQLQNLITDLS